MSGKQNSRKINLITSLNSQNLSSNAQVNLRTENYPQLVSFIPVDLKCPVCHKIVPSDDVEYHLVVCLTRPRLTYNDDVLTEDKGECVICFDEMRQGDTIARLPCLCIYHKGCIDSWFKVKNSCPEHPSDD
uniref:E3 ubiquitin-protein ligase ZNRF1 n=1 Tax=Romanomermis culicivorax TaxID=13658 RepID=A0A915HYP0_ROMCU